MTKPKLSATKQSSAKPSATADSASWARTIREAIEAIVTALILAFLFRTFEAEAFVIPTGSMAPTLQGRHKDIECPKCHYKYRVSASSEVDENGNRRNCTLLSATCPMCRYTVDVDPKGKNAGEYPSYSGDRIVVNKFSYDVSDPHRWDVVVFKYPEDAKTNYIKRLVGLPNERIRILNGDVYTAPLNSDVFQIARKPPSKLRSMLQPVYDNDYVVPELIKGGVPARWQPWNAPGESTAWKTSGDFKSFDGNGQAQEPAWLRYQNILPTYDDWTDLEKGQTVSPPRPTVVTDFYAYNDGEFSERCNPMRDRSHWVGDLALDCRLDVQSDKGAVTLELVKGGRQFRCRIELATGEAGLSIPGVADFSPTAKTPIHGTGNYRLSFANVDQELVLWVNGDPVKFDKPTTYPALENNQAVTTRPVPGAQTASDLSPAGIAVEGGATASVSHLVLSRDIYYIADPGPVGSFTEEMDRSRILDLQNDQFFVLGDNSPQSKDSRYWSAEKYVDRRLLIGKALFIYWPHSFDAIEIGSLRIPFPFWPNLARMGFVH